MRSSFGGFGSLSDTVGCNAIEHGMRDSSRDREARYRDVTLFLLTTVASYLTSPSYPMSQPELNQTDGLWFPADVIILRAEENIFRVPKSILGARSSVFQAIFEIPQAGSNSVETEEEDEKIDGIPVVRLHDSAADVTAFLRAIFDSR